MRRPSLISHFKHRAFRFNPPPVRMPGFVNRFEVRPQRFVLGLDVDPDWDNLPEAEHTPMDRAFFIGRVNEVSEDGVIATIWQRPGGQEYYTTLSIQQHFKGEPPPKGSLIHVWTWHELPGGGEVIPKVKVVVFPPKLSDEERAELRRFLEEMGVDMDAEDDEDVEDEGAD